jgi:hypothetical protein
MATPTIPNGEEYFFPIIYEGNGGGQRVGKFVPFTDNGTIDNSCIFNSPDNPVLERTPSGTGTSKKTFTISAWVKRSRLINSASFHSQNIFGVNHGSNSRYGIFGLYNNGSGNPTQVRLFLGKYTTGSSTTGYDWVTNRTLEDTSKWYHLMAVVDTTDDTDADRVKLYIDGERVTSFASSSNPDENDEFYFGSEHDYYISTYNGSNGHWDGYMAEINFVDGTALGPDTFGVVDTSTGRWIPKTLSGITYGTNGFRLTFQNNSAVANLGYDYQTSDRSGTTNDFTVTNLATTDQTTDSPTQNHATFDLNDDTGTMPLSEGNREVTQSGSSSGAIRGTLAPSSGKYYFEFTAISVAGSDGFGGVGIQLKNEPVDAATSIGTIGANTYIYRDDGYMVHDGDGTSGFTNYGSGAIIGVALDLDNGKLYFSYSSGAGTDGVFENSGDPVAGTGAVYTLPSNQRYAPYLVFKGSSGQNYSLNTGQTSFNTTPPTGFVALQQDNLPETSKGISGLVWTKNRDAADNHQLYDSSRGKQLAVTTDTTAVESTVTDGLQKFLKGGQQIEDNNLINTNGESFVSWNWVANGGTTVTNDASATGVGDIDSVYQANTTSGFSIVTYTGTGSAGTIAHGLGSKPHWVMTKPRDNSSDGFSVLHNSLGTNFLDLQTNAKENTNTVVWNSVPTPTVFGVGTATGSNSSGVKYIAYCWAPIDGFSKFGQYTGNGSTDGTFVYTGFRPAFVLMKRTNSTGNWYLKDTTRDTFNPCEKTLMPNLTNVEAAQTYIDILSNGFKQRIGNDASNLTNSTYIYIAFAEHPFVGDGTNPVTAR